MADADRSRILALAPDSSIWADFAAILRPHPFDLDFATSIAEASALPQWDTLDLVLVDHGVADATVQEWLTQLRHQAPELPVIVAIEHGDLAAASKAHGHGAYECVFKPPHAETLLASLGRAARWRRCQAEQQELRQQVLEIAAQQNRRIGHELHDNIQQQLTGLSLLAQTLAEQLAGRDASEAILAGRIANEVDRAAKLIHLLARGLVPTEIDARDLGAALDDLAARTSELYQVRCLFRGSAPVAVADDFLATHLYRIAQEGINNAIKHGRAQVITLSLSQREQRLLLRIVDDGVGISHNEAFQPGIGLRIMAYRAGLIGASLSVKSRPSGGTEIECEL